MNTVDQNNNIVGDIDTVVATKPQAQAQVPSKPVANSPIKNEDVVKNDDVVKRTIKKDDVVKRISKKQDKSINLTAYVAAVVILVAVSYLVYRVLSWYKSTRGESGTSELTNTKSKRDNRSFGLYKDDEEATNASEFDRSPMNQSTTSVPKDL